MKRNKGLGRGLDALLGGESTQPLRPRECCRSISFDPANTSRAPG